MARLRKDFNYFLHKVTWINKINEIVIKSHKKKVGIKIDIGNFHCVV